MSKPVTTVVTTTTREHCAKIALTAQQVVTALVRYYDLEMNPDWNYRLYIEGESLDAQQDYDLDSGEVVLTLRGSHSTRASTTSRT